MLRSEIITDQTGQQVRQDNIVSVPNDQIRQNDLPLDIDIIMTYSRSFFTYTVKIQIPIFGKQWTIEISFFPDHEDFSAITDFLKNTYGDLAQYTYVDLYLESHFFNSWITDPDFMDAITTALNFAGIINSNINIISIDG